jgi:hypothetical protein
MVMNVVLPKCMNLQPDAPLSAQYSLQPSVKELLTLK